MPEIERISGIGQVLAQAFSQVGINTTESLLQEGATSKGRQRIAEKTKISPGLILRWVNQADLFRVKGVGEQYADLLEVAGVDTVAELAQRKPENLYQKMVEVNEKRSRVRQVPSLSQVKRWVNEAGELSRVVTY
ncbi:MAG: DUF4332 domain-containing protein [Pyrinomonadaceae bacterium]